jgi:hypothetical protein
VSGAGCAAAAAKHLRLAQHEIFPLFGKRILKNYHYAAGVN